MKKAITCVLLAMLPACADVYEDEALEDDAQADVAAVTVGTLSATPDPLTFPKALVGQTVHAMLTVTNGAKPKTLPQTIKAVGAKAPFGVTAGGTCHSRKGGMVIGPGQSCTLELSFTPQKPNTVIKGTGTVTFASGTVLKFGLSGVGLELGVTAMPDPLVFPDATFGGTTCGSPGGTACTYGMIMIHNNLPTAQTITGAFATAPFWVTWGGSCNALEYDKTIPAYGGCELQWGFAPDAAGTTYAGKGTVSFKSGLGLSFGLEGSSTK
jgi:hypothetical protein